MIVGTHSMPVPVLGAEALPEALTAVGEAGHGHLSYTGELICEKGGHMKWYGSPQ